MEPDEFDHESHMRRAFELARGAGERGDRPFGSVLVVDDEVVAEASNHTVTEEDLRRHPELHLAQWADRELPAEKRADAVLYTSTEPCPMCSGGIMYAGLGRVVYSVSADGKAEFTGGEAPPVGAAEILAGTTEFVGPLLNEEGRAVHEDFGW